GWHGGILKETPGQRKAHEGLPVEVTAHRRFQREDQEVVRRVSSGDVPAEAGSEADEEVRHRVEEERREQEQRQEVAAATDGGVARRGAGGFVGETEPDPR